MICIGLLYGWSGQTFNQDHFKKVRTNVILLEYQVRSMDTTETFPTQTANWTISWFCNRGFSVRSFPTWILGSPRCFSWNISGQDGRLASATPRCLIRIPPSPVSVAMMADWNNNNSSSSNHDRSNKPSCVVLLRPSPRSLPPFPPACGSVLMSLLKYLLFLKSSQARGRLDFETCSSRSQAISLIWRFIPLFLYLSLNDDCVSVPHTRLASPFPPSEFFFS